MINKKLLIVFFLFLLAVMVYLAVSFFTVEGRSTIPISSTKSIEQLTPYLNDAENGYDEQAVHLIPKLFGSEGEEALVSLWQNGKIGGVHFERVKSSLTLRLILAAELILIDKENIEEYKKFIYKYLYNNRVEVRSVATFALGNIDKIQSVEELQKILSDELEGVVKANAVASLDKLYKHSSSSQVKLKAQDVLERSGVSFYPK